MKKFPVALQLYSVRDDMAADFAGTLEKVAGMGYQGVEFAGLYDHTPDEVRALQPQCLRYDFSVEPAAVVRQVLEGAVPRSMTRGHFRHGIE